MRSDPHSKWCKISQKSQPDSNESPAPGTFVSDQLTSALHRSIQQHGIPTSSQLVDGSMCGHTGLTINSSSFPASSHELQANTALILNLTNLQGSNGLIIVSGQQHSSLSIINTPVSSAGIASTSVNTQQDAGGGGSHPLPHHLLQTIPQQSAVGISNCDESNIGSSTDLQGQKISMNSSSHIVGRLGEGGMESKETSSIEHIIMADPNSNSLQSILDNVKFNDCSGLHIGGGTESQHIAMTTPHIAMTTQHIAMTSAPSTTVTASVGSDPIVKDTNLSVRYSCDNLEGSFSCLPTSDLNLDYLLDLPDLDCSDLAGSVGDGDNMEPLSLDVCDVTQSAASQVGIGADGVTSLVSNSCGVVTSLVTSSCRSATGCDTMDSMAPAHCYVGQVTGCTACVNSQQQQQQQQHQCHRQLQQQQHKPVQQSHVSCLCQPSQQHSQQQHDKMVSQAICSCVFHHHSHHHNQQQQLVHHCESMNQQQRGGCISQQQHECVSLASVVKETTTVESKRESSMLVISDYSPDWGYTQVRN